MTFDEFLVSKKISDEFDRDFVIKIAYNSNVDYIFKTNYGSLDFNSELKCIGLFDKKNKKLYGSSYDFQGVFNKEMYSNFYTGSIESIKNLLYENADKLLNTYIKNNSEILKNMAQETFDKYILYEGNYKNIKDEAVKDYIYNLDKSNLEFHINTSKFGRSNDINALTMEHIEFPEETEIKVFNEYINNEEKKEHVYSYEGNNIELTVKEKIGLRLLENDLKNKLINELKNNPSNEYKIKHDIVETIKDIDAQMLTIKISHNGKEIIFKYPKNELYNFWISNYHILEVSKRNEVKELYKGNRNYNDFNIEDIKSISFRKQILFENKKEIELNNEQEELDLVDEMFD